MGRTLKPCPESPNCVSSLADDAAHRVLPLRWAGDPAEAKARLRRAIVAAGNARFAEEEDGYWRVEFRSTVFGFVDDVEFVFDPGGTIQVRSAARKGYWDFNVNRNRIEKIRELFG